MHILYLFPDDLGLCDPATQLYGIDPGNRVLSLEDNVAGYWPVTLADGECVVGGYAILTKDQDQYFEAMRLAEEWSIRAVPVVRLIHGNKEGSPAHCVRLHEDGSRTAVGLGSMRRFRPYQRDSIPWPYILDSGRYYTFEGDLNEHLSLSPHAARSQAA